jgi:hypothetical protein
MDFKVQKFNILKPAPKHKEPDVNRQLFALGYAANN